MRTIIITIAAMIALVGLSQYANADTTKYLKFGCANNGTGNADNCAASNGAAGAYNTLSNWEAQNADLTGTGIQTLNVLCHDCSSADSTAVYILSWTTTASDYINIVVDSSARHSGVWSTSKYRLDTSYAYGSLRILPSTHLKMDGIQIGNTSSSGAEYSAIQLQASGNSGSLTIANSILKSTSYYAIGSSNDGCLSLNIYNNLLISTGGATAVFRFHPSTCTFDIYNNTFISGGGSYGVVLSGRTSWAGIANFKNNLIYGAATTDYAFENYGSGTLTTANNATADTSSPNDTYDSQCTETNGSDCFVDSANGDYHLISTADVIDDGADLSGTFTTDIDGQTRAGSWDIGADEYQASGSAVAALISMGQLGY